MATLEGHAPSWPMNPIPGDIEKSSRVVCDSLSLRERERVRVKATKIFAVLECVGVSPSPRPSPAGRGGIVRRVAVLEGHAPSWPPAYQGRDEARPSMVLYLRDATTGVPPDEIPERNPA